MSDYSEEIEIPVRAVERDRPLPESIRYESSDGQVEMIPMGQVALALRERFLVDIQQMPVDVIQDYVKQWKQEVEWQNNQLLNQRNLPMVTVVETYMEDTHDPPVRVPTRVPQEEVLEDLWARHVTEKNEYVAGSDGRRIVRRRVFQRRDAPEWTWDNCHYCLSSGVVCREHQFELRGIDGIERYVKEVMQTGWFRHAWYPYIARV